MRAALNIAVYYEMKDSLPQAQEWAEKAQQLAKKIEKKNVSENMHATIDDVPNYYLTSLYLAELKERNSQLPKLKMQMSRFLRKSCTKSYFFYTFELIKRRNL